jgi:hypothetical protein
MIVQIIQEQSQKHHHLNFGIIGIDLNTEGIVQKIHTNQIHHLHHLRITNLKTFEVVNTRKSLKDTRRIVLSRTKHPSESVRQQN